MRETNLLHFTPHEQFTKSNNAFEWFVQSTPLAFSTNFAFLDSTFVKSISDLKNFDSHRLSEKIDFFIDQESTMKIETSSSFDLRSFNFTTTIDSLNSTADRNAPPSNSNTFQSSDNSAFAFHSFATSNQSFILRKNLFGHDSRRSTKIVVSGKH